MSSQIFVTLLTSVFFVVVGSLAFNFASMITGYSIFKQLTPQQATYVTGAVGSVIFMLSPLGHLIFYPETYVEDHNNFEDGTHFPDTIWRLVWSYDTLLPFMLCLIAFGFIYGSLKMMNLRWRVLNFVRDKTGIPFSVPADQYVWDEFFDTIKDKAPLTIETLEPDSLSHKLITISPAVA